MKNYLTLRSAASPLLLAALVLCPAAAHADTVFVAAGEASDNASTYGTVGGITALPGSNLGNGWVARVFAEELTYRYKTNDQTIDATAGGGVVMAGYQRSNQNGWFGVYAGPDFRYTHLSPGDPTNEAEGDQVAARIQLEGEAYFTNYLKLNVGTSFEAFGNGDYWIRARPLYRLDESTYIGPEVVFQGDDKYTAWQTGFGVVGMPLTDTVALGFMGGIHKTEGFAAGPYGEAELSASFQ